MAWIRTVTRALAAGREVQAQPRGASIYPRFDQHDLLTFAPASAVDVRSRDLVFIRIKNNLVIRLVLDTRDGELLIARKCHDEGDWVAAEAVLGKVVRIEKQYVYRDLVNPKICYEYLSTGSPPSEAWGDYGTGSFDFRARYDYWEFVYSPDAEFPAQEVADLTWYDLDAVQASDHPFPEDQVAAFRRCFVRSEPFGKKGNFDASYMSKEDAVRIIRECLSECDGETQEPPD
ncbi:MAG: hypothetical protein ACO1SX_11070 [Actinomycetota bacterium]